MPEVVPQWRLLLQEVVVDVSLPYTVPSGPTRSPTYSSPLYPSGGLLVPFVPVLHRTSDLPPSHWFMFSSLRRPLPPNDTTEKCSGLRGHSGWFPVVEGDGPVLRRTRTESGPGSFPRLFCRPSTSEIDWSFPLFFPIPMSPRTQTFTRHTSTHTHVTVTDHPCNLSPRHTPSAGHRWRPLLLSPVLDPP